MRIKRYCMSSQGITMLGDQGNEENKRRDQLGRRKNQDDIQAESQMQKVFKKGRMTNCQNVPDKSNKMGTNNQPLDVAMSSPQRPYQEH